MISPEAIAEQRKTPQHYDEIKDSLLSLPVYRDLLRSLLIDTSEVAGLRALNNQLQTEITKLSTAVGNGYIEPEITWRSQLSNHIHHLISTLSNPILNAAFSYHASQNPAYTESPKLEKK